MAGIYIHIPFCKQKCTYCDFHFTTTFQSYRSRMIEAICQEIKLQKNYLQNQAIQTIYFGGGTPSLLTTEELSQILTTIHQLFPTNTVKEITLEANPDDISTENILNWKTVGINRLSIGIQSFKESDLQWMNRAHSVDEGLKCIQIAVENGIPNLTVDLIYGLPGLTNEEWVEHIETVVNLGVQHISAYCLTIEKGTGLNHLVTKKKIVPASENQQAEQFLLLVDTLEKYGFQQYEISNFCKQGFESIHNSNYWNSTHYLGIGPSAHSFNGTTRSWNVRNNQRYMQAIEKQEEWYETEVLSTNDCFNELLLTGLRTSKGVNLLQLGKLIPLNSTFNKQIEQYKQLGFLIQNGTYIQLTKEGRLQADKIASDLFIL